MRNKLQQLQKDMKRLDVSKLQDTHRGEYNCLKEIVDLIKVCDEHTYQILWNKYDTLKLLIEYIESKKKLEKETLND